MKSNKYLTIGLLTGFIVGWLHRCVGMGVFCKIFLLFLFVHGIGNVDWNCYRYID